MAKEIIQTENTCPVCLAELLPEEDNCPVCGTYRKYFGEFDIKDAHYHGFSDKELERIRIQNKNFELKQAKAKGKVGNNINPRVGKILAVMVIFVLMVFTVLAIAGKL